MFAKLFKTKPLLIYLIGSLCILIGLYFGYQYYINNRVVKIEKMTDSGLTPDSDADDVKPDQVKPDQVPEEPAYKKNKITSEILPFASTSSVGPPTSGVAFNSAAGEPIEGMQSNTNPVQTFKF